MGRLLTLAASALALSSWSSIAIVSADDSECGLYLAVSASSDADKPKWGLYAGVPIPAASPVGPPEIAIITQNMVGNARTTSSDSDNSAVQTVEFFEDFIWVSDSTGGSLEMTDGRVVSAIPGAGALGGYNQKLTNSYWDVSGAYLKDVVGEDGNRGVPHVGRGASSHFYNITLRSSEAIPAGSEIFLHYGDAWEQDSDDDEDSAELNKEDFNKLDKLVDQMVEFFAKYNGELTYVAKSDIYEFLIHDIVQAAAGTKKGATIRTLLPASADELIDVKKAGGALKYSQPSSTRDLEWLKRNGKCMDNLVMGASTIPHAGRGAFARRRIQAGGLVSPTPLIHIPNKDVMNMYKLKKTFDSGKKKSSFRRANDVVIGKQLLLNYCFGHPESTMLFYPAGAMTSFINHSAEKPNVRMRFTDQNKEWMEIPPEDLLDESHASMGLMMEVIALRDIEEGEEVLMDYGPEWQAAWDAHVESWKQGVASGEINDPWPVRALDLSDEYKAKPFPTVAEGVTCPDNIRQMCFLVVRNLVDGDTSIKTWTIPKDGYVYDVENLFDCQVLERIALDDEAEALFSAKARYNYTIEWFHDDGKAHAPGSGSKVFNVPHAAIVFVDKAETSDQFVRQAFRHEIGIPDDIFPEGPWRNLASSATAEE